MSNSGAPFERKICRILSEWWTQDLDEPRDDIYWRTSQSGGRATTRGKKGKTTKNQCGDICATDPRGQPLLDVFALELKKGYSKFTPFDSFDAKPNNAPIFNEWVKQAQRSMEQSCSISWMIIFQRNSRMPVVAMPRDMARELHLMSFPTLDFYGVDENKTAVRMVHLDSFLALVEPKRIIELAGEKCS